MPVEKPQPTAPGLVTIAVGLITEPEQAEAILATEEEDAVALAMRGFTMQHHETLSMSSNVKIRISQML